jgi:hypothetical protein
MTLVSDTREKENSMTTWTDHLQAGEDAPEHREVHEREILARALGIEDIEDDDEEEVW